MPENPYNALPYATFPRRETHPDRLAAVATLFGMEPAPVGACRVLEIGCGDGANLIPMAYHLPGSRFTGIDLADQPIAAGRATADALGLRNIELAAADLCRLDDGEFDYIIAHGVYSWVPPEVADRLLAVCRARLAPQGVAFISYNTYPGRHIRQMLREMMLQHVGPVMNEAERVERARWFLEWLGKSRLVSPEWQGLLDREVARVLGYPPNCLAHDDLSADNHACYFREFACRAQAHGLQYVGEAEPHLMFDPRGVLDWLEGGVIEREQYLDFVFLRSLRQTLLCRQEVVLERPIRPERLEGLLFSSPARMVEGCPEANGVRLKSGQPAVEAVAVALGQAYPLPLTFAELLPYGGGAEVLRGILLAFLTTGFALCHAYGFPCEESVTAKPAASRLARYQAARSTMVTSACHVPVELDEAGRNVLLLLDGTRDWEAIARELAERPGAMQPEEIRGALPESLAWFAGMGLLEG